jgi:hypothetical protein
VIVTLLQRTASLHPLRAQNVGHTHKPFGGYFPHPIRPAGNRQCGAATPPAGLSEPEWRRASTFWAFGLAPILGCSGRFASFGNGATPTIEAEMARSIRTKKGKSLTN